MKTSAAALRKPKQPSRASAHRPERGGAEGVSSARVERLLPLLPAAACGALIAAGWLLEGRGPWPSLLLAAAFVIGGWRPTVEGLRALRTGQFDVDLLMVIAALGAAALGLPVDGAILIFIFALSNALEDYALRRSRREMSSLLALRPTHASVVGDDGEEQLVEVARLRAGDRVVVRPGAQIPCDGRVLEGASYVDQASITGESAPVSMQPGSDVFAGTINQTGTLLVEVTREPGDTLLDRIVELVDRARLEKSRTQRAVERFERVYSWAVVAGVAIAFAVMAGPLGWPVREALFRSLVLLIIASPCAIVLSSMPAVLAAMSNGARQGILFKGGGFLEQLGNARVVALDKTGTLTTGRPQVVAVEPVAAGWSEDELIAVAASLEEMVDHPIGEAILTEARRRGLQWERAEDVQIHMGIGVSGRVDGRPVWIGSPARMGAFSRDGADGAAPLAPPDRAAAGETFVAMLVDGVPVGRIAVAEALRPGAREVIRALKEAGIERIVMLTGDNEASAAAMAARLEIDYMANLLPDQKAHAIDALRREHGTVIMVGDGVNDGPALVHADVGVAMGVAGTDVAMEAADVVLMADDLTKIPVALRLGQRVNRTVAQNLSFAVLVIAVLVVANFAGWLSLPMAVVGHEGSSLLVALNGLRLLR